MDLSKLEERLSLLQATVNESAARHNFLMGQLEEVRNILSLSKEVVDSVATDAKDVVEAVQEAV